MSRSQRPLRAVDPDEKPEPREPRPLPEAIRSGTYREILIAQREDIVAALPGEKGPAKAALHRQLSLISREIAAMGPQDEDDDRPPPDESWDPTKI